jgi:acetyltransferase-like isoleucine patch superfamily enzyme
MSRFIRTKLAKAMALGRSNPLLRSLSNTLRALKWRHSDAVGRGTYIDQTVQFIGMRHIRIGSNCQIGEGTWLNVNHQPSNGRPAIEIGNHCLIGRRNFVSPGVAITLGDFLLTGSDCAFVDADHVIDDPRRPYVSMGATGGGSLVVEPNCWFGLRATVLGAVRIGRGSVIGANATIISDVPPFSVVVGSPARVVKRFCFARNAWVSASEVLVEEDLQQPDLDTYVAYLNMRSQSNALPRAASGRRAGNIY